MKQMIHRKKSVERIVYGLSKMIWFLYWGQYEHLENIWFLNWNQLQLSKIV